LPGSQGGGETADSHELLHDCRFFFGVGERSELLLDVAPIERFFVTNRNTLGVPYVNGPRGEELHYHQVLCGAGTEFDVRREREGCSPLDYKIFEWKSAKRDVDANPRGRDQKQYSGSKSELGGIVDSRAIGDEQAFDENCLSPEASQKSEGNIASHARLAPSLDGNPSYKATPPALPIAEFLQDTSSLEQID
jgi:hypothetical protein